MTATSRIWMPSWVFPSVLVICWVLGAPGAAARAADSTEVWPEVSGFITLSDATRIYLDAAFARGKESDVQSLDAAAYLDISLKDVMPGHVIAGDWWQAHSVWARIGYDRISNATTGERGSREVAENRGIVALYAKSPLPAGMWLEWRLRTDLRWIGDEYSARYRFKLDATRELKWREHPVVPYFNVEVLYDTRYDDWARTIFTTGAEVALTEHFRYELYMGLQKDRLPEEKSLNAFGVVAKWYY
jgi:hypothetical protein